jgi:hypothetical protein
MQMTDAQIIRSYRQAKNKYKQITILSQLNACSKKTIKDILEKNGIQTNREETDEWLS